MPHEVAVERMERLVEVVQRRAARARAAVRRPHARRARRGHVAQRRRAAIRGRTRHNKVVNFDGLASPGEIVPVEITAATSQTLTGEMSLLAARRLTPLPSDAVCEHMFVRWQSQTVDAELDPRLPGFSEDVVVRRFDAPEALDTRFHEVRTKSAINRVPAALTRPVRVDGEPISWLLSCLQLLRMGRHAGPHGRRPDPQARGPRASATRSSGRCATAPTAIRRHRGARPLDRRSSPSGR